MKDDFSKWDELSINSQDSMSTKDQKARNHEAKMCKFAAQPTLKELKTILRRDDYKDIFYLYFLNYNIFEAFKKQNLNKKSFIYKINAKFFGTGVEGESQDPTYYTPRYYDKQLSSSRSTEYFKEMIEEKKNQLLNESDKKKLIE